MGRTLETSTSSLGLVAYGLALGEGKSSVAFAADWHPLKAQHKKSYDPARRTRSSPTPNLAPNTLSARTAFISTAFASTTEPLFVPNRHDNDGVLGDDERGWRIEPLRA